MQESEARLIKLLVWRRTGLELGLGAADLLHGSVDLKPVPKAGPAEVEEPGRRRRGDGELRRRRLDPEGQTESTGLRLERGLGSRGGCVEDGACSSHTSLACPPLEPSEHGAAQG